MILDRRAVLVLARRELRETLRRRTLWVYTACLALLALALSMAGARSAGYAGLGGFGRTSASLVNALLLFIPLLAFSAGTSAMLVDRERGSLGYLLAQPITRSDLFAAKALGALAALLGVLLAAFAIISVGLWAASGTSIGPLLTLFVHSAIYAGACLALGLAVGSLSSGQASATGITIAIWLCLALLGDAAFLIATLALHPTSGVLLSILLANPAQAFRLGAVSGLQGDLGQIGPLGAYAEHELGAMVGWVPVLALLAWTLVAGLGAYAATLRRQIS